MTLKEIQSFNQKIENTITLGNVTIHDISVMPSVGCYFCAARAAHTNLLLKCILSCMSLYYLAYTFSLLFCFFGGHGWLCSLSENYNSLTMINKIFFKTCINVSKASLFQQSPPTSLFPMLFYKYLFSDLFQTF